MTVRIGITGPIGCGKSTVAGWLRDLGAVVIDADRVAQQVTGPGSAVEAATLRAFGPSVAHADGTLDRAALARIVFADPARLEELESIVHPAVRPVILSGIADAEAAGAPAIAIEAIKLVEGGLAELCDEVWLVTCSAAAQHARVMARVQERGLDPEDGKARIAAQAGLADRLAPHATRVIDTSGTREEAESQVMQAWAAVQPGRPATA